MQKLSFTLLLLLTISVCNGQIKLKEKLSKKANQELDKLLFGKKDASEKDEESSVADDSMESEPVTDTMDSDPLGGYHRTPVDFSSMTSSQVVGFRDLINFLPDQLGTYQLSSEPDGSTMKYGEYNYSSAMKQYEDGRSELSASIFDYVQTGAILAGYTNQYEYESSDGMLKSLELSGHSGWYTADFTNNTNTAALVVNNRFLIMISGVGLSEDQMKAYLQSMELPSLPSAAEQPGE